MIHSVENNLIMNSTILNIVNNREGLYEGDLKQYFKMVFEAPNVFNPYHNFRHMLHMT